MTACLQIDVPVTFDVDDCCSMANQSLLPLASYADEWCAGSGSSWSDTVTTNKLSRSRVWVVWVPAISAAPVAFALHREVKQSGEVCGEQGKLPVPL